MLDKWIVPHLGAASLRDLGTARVLDWRAEILEHGCPPTQANHALSILSAALGVAVERGMLPANPCRPVRRLPVRVVRPRALTAEEVERIRAERPTARDAAMVSLGAYAGLRPQEALALTWDAVRERVLWIDSADDGHGRVKGTKTRLARSVPLIRVVAEDLDRLRQKGVSGGELVVTGSRHGPLDLKNWRSRVWHPALVRAGVKRAVPYDLRHTFASLMIYDGASVVEVAAAMGHARPTLTLERYAHLFADADGAPRVPLAEAATAARNALARADVLSLFSEDSPALDRRAAEG